MAIDLKLSTGGSVDSNYELGERLGKGSFGAVHECRNRHTGFRYACKVIEKSRLRDEVDAEDVRREVRLLKRLAGHPHVVELQDVFEDASRVYLVMELCEGGDLFDEIKRGGPFSESDAKDVFRQLATALAYCHAHGIMHRDLKPENVLFLTGPALPKAGGAKASCREKRGGVSMARGERPCGTKLADFGLALELGGGQTATGLTGSRYYTAPEMVRGKRYGKRADVWSLGVVLCTLLTGRLPFAGRTHDDDMGLRRAICRGVVNFEASCWQPVSPLAKDLVRAMLAVDPRRRLKARHIVEHPWLACATEAPAPAPAPAPARWPMAPLQHCSNGAAAPTAAAAAPVGPASPSAARSRSPARAAAERGPLLPAAQPGSPVPSSVGNSRPQGAAAPEGCASPSPGGHGRAALAKSLDGALAGLLAAASPRQVLRRGSSQAGADASAFLPASPDLSPLPARQQPSPALSPQRSSPFRLPSSPGLRAHSPAVTAAAHGTVASDVALPAPAQPPGDGSAAGARARKNWDAGGATPWRQGPAAAAGSGAAGAGTPAADEPPAGAAQPASAHGASAWARPLDTPEGSSSAPLSAAQLQALARHSRHLSGVSLSSTSSRLSTSPASVQHSPSPRPLFRSGPIHSPLSPQHEPLPMPPRRMSPSPMPQALPQRAVPPHPLQDGLCRRVLFPSALHTNALAGAGGVRGRVPSSSTSHSSAAGSPQPAPRVSACRQTLSGPIFGLGIIDTAGPEAGAIIGGGDGAPPLKALEDKAASASGSGRGDAGTEALPGRAASPSPSSASELGLARSSLRSGAQAASLKAWSDSLRGSGGGAPSLLARRPPSFTSLASGSASGRGLEGSSRWEGSPGTPSLAGAASRPASPAPSASAGTPAGALSRGAYGAHTATRSLLLPAAAEGHLGGRAWGGAAAGGAGAGGAVGGGRLGGLGTASARPAWAAGSDVNKENSGGAGAEWGQGGGALPLALRKAAEAGAQSRKAEDSSRWLGDRPQEKGTFPGYA